MTKKEKIQITLIITISLIFIIVPPTLRKISPQKNEINNKLVCTKKTEDNYKIIATNYYYKNKIQYVKLKFYNNSYKIEDYTTKYSTSSITSNLIKYYSSLSNSTTTFKGDETEIILVDDFSKMTSDVKKMLSSYDKAKKYYIEEHYSCK